MIKKLIFISFLLLLTNCTNIIEVKAIKPQDIIYQSYQQYQLQDIYQVLPDIDHCLPGQVSEHERIIFLQTLNYIRSLHHLKPVVYNHGEDMATAKSALITVAHDQLNHKPPPTYICYTEEGASASLTSNLYHFRYKNKFPQKVESSSKAIINWLSDENYPELGHRRWLLDPFLKTVSLGRADGPPLKSNAQAIFNTAVSLKVVSDDEFIEISEEAPDFVAYPFHDYSWFLFQSHHELSFTAVIDKKHFFNNKNVDYSNAKITITDTNGNEFQVHDIQYDNVHHGIQNNLQWKFEDMEYEKKYQVKITNVISFELDGETKINQKSLDYEYWFRINKS